MSPRTVKCNLISLRTCDTMAKHKGFILQDRCFDYVPEKIRPKHPWLAMDEIERLMQVNTKLYIELYTVNICLFRVYGHYGY